VVDVRGKFHQQNARPQQSYSRRFISFNLAPLAPKTTGLFCNSSAFQHKTMKSRLASTIQC